MRKVILAISAFMLALILPAMPMAGEHKEECGGARKGREMMMHRHGRDARTACGVYLHGAIASSGTQAQ